MRKNSCRSRNRNFTQRAGCIILALLLSAQSIWATQFDYSDHISAAYQSTLALNFQDANFFLDKERSARPDNPLILWLESYRDFLTVFLSEESQDLEAFDEQKSSRIKTLSGAESSPWKSYCHADMLLHSALARIKFEEYTQAAWEIRKAFKLLETNQEQYPDFGPNLKGLGLLHALIGTIPDSYGWIVRLLGLSGEVDQGIGELKQFLDYSEANQFLLYEEGILMYAFMLVYVGNDRETAVEIIDNLAIDESLMNVFVIADISMRCGRNDQAIRVLEERPSGESYFDFVFLDFLLGTAKLARLDDDSHLYLRRFVQDFKGRHYIKQAWQRLAWSYLVEGDEARYKETIANAILEGNELMDADKQALQEASSDESPNPIMLKAELLFNGGYYAKALETIEEIKDEQLQDDKEVLEYAYRKGRILEGLGREEEAAILYQRTVANGIELHYYYAAKAALQLALMYERKGQDGLAEMYYDSCLKSKRHSYKDSIDQQAKAGLNRLRNRAANN